MTDETVIRLVPPLLALQFASFGWRINREIAVGDAGRRTWLPLPDYINILSMLAVVSCAILTPLCENRVSNLSRLVVGVAYVLLAFHPVTMAAHYRLLWGRGGRSIYKKDFPWVTGQEILSASVSIVLAALTGWLLRR
jgi:hypothetical protein